MAIIAIQFSFADDVITKDINRLPQQARNFISTYFPDCQLQHIKIDKELTSTSYEVYMTDGTEIDFDGKGNWTDVDREKCGTKVPDALIPDICVSTAKAKFDETVELHVRLGVDSRHADQQVRGAVVLPHGTGKDVRVLVIAKGDAEKAALEAGAELVGAEDMVAKIQNENFMDFDVLITTPDMMGLVGRLGRVLGPRGLMPNPKAGTVTPNVGQAVKEAKAGKIEYRLDKANIIHVPVGKASFGTEKLSENIAAVMDAIVKAKPAAAKGQYLRSCAIATTMGPGLKLNSAKFGA